MKTQKILHIGCFFILATACATEFSGYSKVKGIHHKTVVSPETIQGVVSIFKKDPKPNDSQANDRSPSSVQSSPDFGSSSTTSEDSKIDQEVKGYNLVYCDENIANKITGENCRAAQLLKAYTESKTADIIDLHDDQRVKISFSQIDKLFVPNIGDVKAGDHLFVPKVYQGPYEPRAYFEKCIVKQVHSGEGNFTTSCGVYSTKQVRLTPKLAKNNHQ